MPATAIAPASPGVPPRTIAMTRAPPTSCSVERTASATIAATCSRRGASEVIGRSQARDDPVADVGGARRAEARDRRLARGGVHVQAHDVEQAPPPRPPARDGLEARDR